MAIGIGHLTASKYVDSSDNWFREQRVSAGEYLQAVQQIQIFSRQLVVFFEHFDVLLLPVYLHQPIKIGQWAHLSPQETLEKIINWIAQTLSKKSGNSAMSAIDILIGDDHI